MITDCPMCHQLYEGLESEAFHPNRRCPRCAAFAELLALCDELPAVLRSLYSRKTRRTSESWLSRLDGAVQKARVML